jgi:hypothetical protein
MSYTNENRSRSRSASGGRPFRGAMNTGTFSNYRSSNRAAYGGNRNMRQKTWPIYELEKVVQDLKRDSDLTLLKKVMSISQNISLVNSKYL